MGRLCLLFGWYLWYTLAIVAPSGLRKEDHLALLSGTLKTYQRAACDEEQMTLKCPPGTIISVALARYGRADVNAIGRCNSSFAPVATTAPSTIAATMTVATPATIISRSLHDTKRLNRTCLWPDALRTVVEVCHKKRQCRFNTSPETFQADPCPGLPKYVEVAYKCRPYEFRSKVACENDMINLICYPGRRIAIFSASFGRTKYESLQCPQPRGVNEETCTASYATETVMQMCHGKRRCSVAANGTTFADPCSPDSRTYLKVVYTCVPRTVLREQYEGDTEPDEVEPSRELEEGFDRADFRAEFSPSPNIEGTAQQGQAPSRPQPPQPPLPPPSPPPPRPKPKPQPRDNALQHSTPVPTSSPPHAHTNDDDSGNHEKFYLYIIGSVAAATLLFLGVAIGRLLVSRHRTKRDGKFPTNNEALPNGFTDDISEIDADIDLTIPVPVPMQDARMPETQLADRLHSERLCYADMRMPLSSTTTGAHHLENDTGMRIDLGNRMVAADNLHTILQLENPRSLTAKNYYYG